MKNVFVISILFCLIFSGCALLDKMFVPKYNEQGSEIGREPTEITKAVADVVPYGDVALNVILLMYAGVARFKQYKTEKGLKATVLAIKNASQDPEIKEAVNKVKESYLRPAHENSGATNLIKLLLAKV